jgi:ParB family chromosome partitioning protein
MINKNKKALGKNLSSILKNSDNTFPDMNFNDQSSNKLLIKNIQLNQIKVNNSQPRLFFDKHKLISLANSIKEIGIIQPITVRNIGYKKFQIISGERRFRACKIAKLDDIPAYIIKANDKEILEMALVENVQREDLSVIEIANGFQLLIQECGITQEKLSHRLGKKRSTITNYLRSLKLNPIIQAGLNDNIIVLHDQYQLYCNLSQLELLDLILMILNSL